MGKRNRRQRRSRRTDSRPRREHRRPQTGHGLKGRISDPSGRGFPPRTDRQRIVESIRAIDAANRAPDDWYALGSLLIYEACLEDDDELLNEGTEALVNAAEAVPPVPDAILDLTWLLNLRGLPAVALRYACCATELLPNLRDTWRFRANTHLQLKQVEEAKACLRKAAALPGSIQQDRDDLEKLERGDDLAGGRGIVLFGAMEEHALHRDQEQTEEEIKLHRFYARQALALYPDNSDFLYMAAHCAYALNRHDDAGHYLVQLLEHAPAHADGLVMRALIEQKRGHIEDAVRFYKSVSTDGTCVVGVIAFVKCCEAIGDHDKAFDAMQTGLDRSPGDPRLVECLISKMLECNQADKADEVLGKYRPHLESRGATDLTYQLEEQVARSGHVDPMQADASAKDREIVQELALGESKNREFKSTLRWNIRAKQQDDAMTHSCLKTIAAFLNTYGGILFIGVDDDGCPLGLELDKFPNDDKFQLHLMNVVKQSLGDATATLVDPQIHSVNEKSICRVACSPPPDRHPICLKFKKSEEEFFVRTGPGTTKLPPSQMMKYMETRRSTDASRDQD